MNISFVKPYQRLMKKECCNINEVIQEFYDHLKAYILSKTNDLQLTEDLVQEVMIKLIESHQKSNEVKNIKAWLFQVSRNTMYDYFKRHQIPADLDDDWKLHNSNESEHSSIMVEDYIIPMIDMLPKEYAIPLKMSDIDNIPQKEIAKKLDLGLSATKMRIQRARIKLGELFVECCHIEYDKKGAFVSCTIKPSCDPLHEISKQLKDKL